ncbi:MAG: DUF2189 domain-containing protein [Phenylobacterium sp.]
MANEHHIRNPFEMAVSGVTGAVSDAGRVLAEARPRTAERDGPVAIRRIAPADLWDALKKGAGDIGAARDDVLFIALIYPLAGLLLASLALNNRLTPLVFPLISGFALLGPLAAIGLYEISRRREKGEPVSMATPLAVLKSPALGDVLRLAAILVMIFFAWMIAAWSIYAVTLGPEAPTTSAAFMRDVLTTPAGWSMIALGVAVGAVFAAATFAISVVSFPMMLDRHVQLPTAVGASWRAIRENPGTMALWGLSVAGLLVLGSLPALAGLVFVVPLLGHASWHLYRKVVG